MAEERRRNQRLHTWANDMIATVREQTRPLWPERRIWGDAENDGRLLLKHAVRKRLWEHGVEIPETFAQLEEIVFERMRIEIKLEDKKQENRRQAK